MAEIQNERDKILQAAPVRFVMPDIDPGRIPGLPDAIDATKGVRIDAPSNVFQIDAGGVASPASITLVATLTNVSGPITWTVVAGDATLAGTGASRTLTAANMVSRSVTIRASVTHQGIEYSDDWTIAKTEDGQPGGAGSPGDAVDVIFRRDPGQPATPAPSTGTPAGWYSDVSQVPPIDAPMWSSFGMRAGAAANFIWQTPLRIEGSDGKAGLSVAELTIYRRATSTPATPSGGSFNFGTQTLTPPANWSVGVPEGTAPTYVSTAVASIQGTSGTAPVAGWSAPVVAFRNGTDGDDGDDGLNGVRGTVHATATRSPATWNDTAANSAITSFTGSSLRVKGDQVTLYNTSAGWAETRQWTGSAWEFLSLVVDGNLIVTGTLSFSKLSGGSAYFSNFSGTVSIGSGNSGVQAVRSTAGNYNQDVVYISDYHDGIADVFPLRIRAMERPRGLHVSGRPTKGTWDFSHPVALIESIGSAGDVSVTLDVRSQRVDTVTVQARNTGSNKQANLATNSHAVYAANGGYGPFTGVHEGLIPTGAAAEIGDIIVDDSLAVSKDVLDALFYVRRAASAGERGAVGVLAQRMPAASHLPAAARRTCAEDEPEPCPFWDDISDGHDIVIFGAVGEGQINVCGRGGDIQRGDLIICSDMPGKGQRQPDDIVRSYTVARARESVQFSGPDDVRLVPCIYLCG